MPAKRNTKEKAKGKSSKKTKSDGGSWLKAFIIAILILLFLRIFLFQSFVIHSSSMAGNLASGDWVIINKIAYGTRSPMTPLSIPFAPLRISPSSENYFVTWMKFPYFRLPGYTEVKQNDILAFNYPGETEIPIDKKYVMVKRCVALPGDTLRIDNNVLYVNKVKLQIANIQYEYRVKTKGHELSDSVIKKYQMLEGGMVNNFGEYDLYLSEEQVVDLRNEKSISSVKRSKRLKNADNSFVFPHDEKYRWTLSDFGPLIIPKEGSNVVITKKNLSVYRDLIEKYENCIVSLRNDSVLINDKSLQEYTFRNNYYFVMDDNRDNGKDSRLWGFLPENHIIGKVSFIVASFDPTGVGLSKVRWNRFFKICK